MSPADVTSDTIAVISVNLRTFIPRCSGDGRFMDQLLTAFAAELPQQIDAIGLAMRTNDFAAATQHAHSLKGTSANLSIEQISDWASELETQLRLGDEANARRVLKVLQANCDAAITAITNAARAIRPAA